jgi:adenylate cyclase
MRFLKDKKMTLEIERKFLVAGDFKALAVGKFEIKQGYLSVDPERTVRVRTAGKKAYLTVKGPSDQSGMSRLEWEKEISHKEAEQLLTLCIPTVIEKTRYIVDFDNHVFEVDEFHSSNKGLVLAEVELSSVNDTVELPNWIGDEVTNDKRYYNSWLSNHPFTTWND